MTATEPLAMFIGGKEVRSGRTYDVVLPWDGAVSATVEEGNEALLDQAITAASRAAVTMKALTAAERSDALLRMAELVTRDADELARLLVLETGKPIREARVEAQRARQTLLFSAIAARELRGEAIPMDSAPGGKGRMALTIREPLGVIGAITPFNLPLNLALHKAAPALAAGNAVVHKPAELTPLTALHLARLFQEAGLPDGAYNVVTGGGETVGKRLVEDPRVRMITFTGSVEVGKSIRKAAGLRRVTLELGGNCPVIIEPDADLELAAERCVTGAFAYSGQICISVQRIFVHESVRDQFLEKLTQRTAALQAGHPMEEATEIASLISASEAERVERWIGDAGKKGAAHITGGERDGARMKPAILADVPDSARMSCEEVFGPVVAVNRYSDVEDAIQRANGTPYGLQSGVFTRDIDMAFRIAKRLEAGGVMINDVPTFRADHMPYGGVKDSGTGREGPRYAIEEMTEARLICWRG